MGTKMRWIKMLGGLDGVRKQGLWMGGRERDASRSRKSRAEQAIRD